jgi:hypothetical protein
MKIREELVMKLKISEHYDIICYNQDTHTYNFVTAKINLTQIVMDKVVSSHQHPTTTTQTRKGQNFADTRTFDNYML